MGYNHMGNKIDARAQLLDWTDGSSLISASADPSGPVIYYLFTPSLLFSKEDTTCL